MTWDSPRSANTSRPQEAAQQTAATMRQLEALRRENDRLTAENVLLKRQILLSRENSGLRVAAIMGAIASWFDEIPGSRDALRGGNDGTNTAGAARKVPIGSSFLGDLPRTTPLSNQVSNTSSYSESRDVNNILGNPEQAAYDTPDPRSTCTSHGFMTTPTRKKEEPSSPRRRQNVNTSSTPASVHGSNISWAPKDDSGSSGVEEEFSETDNDSSVGNQVLHDSGQVNQCSHGFVWTKKTAMAALPPSTTTSAAAAAAATVQKQAEPRQIQEVTRKPRQRKTTVTKHEKSIKAAEQQKTERPTSARSSSRTNRREERASHNSRTQQVTIPGLSSTTKLIGEVAFQLDRRILMYIFNGTKSSSKKSRFYGYFLKNIPDMIEKEILSGDGVSRDNDLAKKLYLRYQYILQSFKPLGYNIDVHAEVSAELVNKYGLLNLPADKGDLQRLDKRHVPIIRGMLIQVTPEHEIQSSIIMLNCLALLHSDDGQPLFVW